MSKVRVNVTSRVNAKSIRRERRNGRDVIVVPSATLPDNIVMNGIRYPADEIEKGYKSLEGTPAPLGHPNIEGSFVSASDPEGLVRGFIGAWNQNVRRENGRVFLDKVIDVEFANQTVGGRAVIEAIDKGEPIHTSTGLYGITHPTTNDADAKEYMTDMVFDHDAILLGEEGAATPEQGVGMLVNGKKALDPEGKSVEVVNSTYIDEEIDWAGTRLVELLERKKNQSVWEQVRDAIIRMVQGGEQASAANKKDEADTMDEKQMKELQDGVATAVATAIGPVLANALADALKPVSEAVTAINSQNQAAAEARRMTLVNQVVAAKLLTEETAKALPEAALSELLANAKPVTNGAAAALNRGFTAPTDGNVATFQLPKGDK